MHVTKPWKTFRNEQPGNIEIQNILKKQFDTLFDVNAEGDAVTEVINRIAHTVTLPKQITVDSVLGFNAFIALLYIIQVVLYVVVLIILMYPCIHYTL